ncbi:hypothetical protein ACI68E_001513 [Malassezia pachydermatis]
MPQGAAHRRSHSPGTRPGMARVRSSLAMTTSDHHEPHPTMHRRMTDIPSRTRSSTNLDASRRARRRTASKVNLAEAGKSSKTSKAAANTSADGWESSHDSSGNENADDGALEVRAALKRKPSATPDGARPPNAVSSATVNPMLLQEKEPISPHTSHTETMPVMATPRKDSTKEAIAAMAPIAASPRSIRSSSSVRSIRSLLAGQGESVPREPVAPVLDTRPVTGMHHGVVAGSGNGPAEDESAADVSQESLRRPFLTRSQSSASALHQHAPSVMRTDTMTASGLLPQRRPDILTRSSSTVSLTEGLPNRAWTGSPSRDHLEQLLTGQRQPVRVVSNDTALHLPVTSSGTPLGPIPYTRSGSQTRISAASIANLLVGPRGLDKRPKPVVSKFAQQAQQLDPAATQAWALPKAEDVPSRIVNVDVPLHSVFHPIFVDRVKAQRRGMTSPPPPEQTQYRYLLDYGLSGPPIDDTALGQAELAPRIKSGWPLPESDQARAQARHEEQDEWPQRKVLVPDSTTTLGPNMIPFHFIHALTSTMENALALDQTEVPVMASLLPGVSDELEEGLDGQRGSEEAVEATQEAPVHFIDNASMRAIAYTAQAVAVQRSHTMTRRFADPMRAALGRVVRMSGYASQLPSNAEARAASASSRRRPLARSGSSSPLWPGVTPSTTMQRSATMASLQSFASASKQ